MNTSQQVVLNGGGKVTLSGAGKRRILYMNTCDKRQVWTTSHCQDQATPRLTVENLTFTRGNATGHFIGSGSGGAVYAQGGQLKVVNSRFINNRCYRVGPDLGGAAIRALDAVPQPAGLRDAQHVHRRRVLQRQRAEQHRGVLDRAEQPVRPQPGDRLRRQSASSRARRAAAAAAPSTTMATTTR